MKHYRIARLMIFAGLLAFVAVVAAQEQTPDQAKQQEEKAKLETKAIALLEQVISESQGLKLPENRIRVQIVAGDSLWDRSPARARTLFANAGALLGQNMIDAADSDREDRQIMNVLRRDLVLSAARHDAELAYQLLRQTQPPAPTNSNANNRRRGGFPEVDNLEQSLLAVIAATDPKIAYQKASESLDKGEYPMSLTRVLAQLQTKDEDAFKKLSEKTLSRLSSDNMLASTQASNLAMTLLRPGPQMVKPATTTTTTASNNNGRVSSAPILSESAYHDLLDRTITAALTATPRTNTGGGGGNARRPARMAGTMVFGSASPDGPIEVFGDSDQGQSPENAQQNNARMLLRNLQGLMPQIDQYLPERSQAVRQKLTDVGIANNPMADFANQMRNVMQQGDSESLSAAAANAPGPLQAALYRQAAQRAIDEGNTDRALEIANRLDETQKNLVIHEVELKKLATNVTEEKLNEIKQKLAALPNDGDRVKYLVDLAGATQKENPKLALRFAEDARAIVSKRAADYRDLENQIRVAEMFATLDPKRSFEVLEPGISQLNELLAAAQVLDGFEVEVFRDGELPLQGGSQLGRIIGRFGQELASLAKIDFERAQSTADRFQFSEPRLMSKLAIVQGVFGVRPSLGDDQRFNFRFLTR